MKRNLITKFIINDDFNQVNYHIHLHIQNIPYQTIKEKPNFFHDYENAIIYQYY